MNRHHHTTLICTLWGALNLHALAAALESRDRHGAARELRDIAYRLQTDPTLDCARYALALAYGARDQLQHPLDADVVRAAIETLQDAIAAFRENDT